ncbi:MAG TPA: hypothetical protein EYP07_14795 [Kiloniellaceae bacterium]|nr:hypothetical protein [Kiloniellaceae bacterium]
MTYRRDPDSFAGVMTALARELGRDDLARALGVSASRIDQLSNPMRADWRLFELALEADRLVGRRGGATPFFEAYARRLALHSLPAGNPSARRQVKLEAAVRAACHALRRGLDLLEQALAPAPNLTPAAAE